MKKSLLLLTAFLCVMSATATDWFPFSEVNRKWNISINGGYSPEKKTGIYGLWATVRGFHVEVGGLGSSHEHDRRVGAWKEKASAMFHVGYQVPIVKAFRIIPVLGMTGVGEVTTDGYDYTFSDTDQVYNKVSTEIKYKFDYGATLVVNHRSLIINLGATRYTLTGGIGLEF